MINTFSSTHQKTYICFGKQISRFHSASYRYDILKLFQIMNKTRHGRRCIQHNNISVMNERDCCCCQRFFYVQHIHFPLRQSNINCCECLIAYHLAMRPNYQVFFFQFFQISSDRRSACIQQIAKLCNFDRVLFFQYL